MALGQQARAIVGVPSRSYEPQSISTLLHDSTGLCLPAKPPWDIVEKLHIELTRALQAPHMQARIKMLGIGPMMSVAEFAGSFRTKSTPRWRSPNRRASNGIWLCLEANNNSFHGLMKK
jgi:hypothetical protein